ncbi:MAG: hypothetical protein GDA56_10905 [Hormoscilla sp. GM7CHS1pb]|nr:hypothetical protein [Hormoscilla sp. GM7CHS1pb]
MSKPLQTNDAAPPDRLTLQIKQRRSWKPRFLVWGGLYTGIALGISVYLFLQTPMLL